MNKKDGVEAGGRSIRLGPIRWAALLRKLVRNRLRHHVTQGQGQLVARFTDTGLNESLQQRRHRRLQSVLQRQIDLSSEVGDDAIGQCRFIDGHRQRVDVGGGVSLRQRLWLWLWLWL